MSREQTIEVALPLDSALESLIAEVEAAERRAEKSGPGERTDIVRYEVLRTSLEAHAAAALARDPACARPAPDAAPLVRDGDRVLVALTMPLEPGGAHR
jgi:hypothetical protein